MTNVVVKFARARLSAAESIGMFGRRADLCCVLKAPDSLRPP